MEIRITLRERARRLKLELFALYLAARDPRTPWYAKLVVAGFVAYALIKLVGEHMATVQVVFIRGLCATVLVLAGILLWQPQSLRTVAGRAGRVVGYRAVIDALSTFGYLWALFHLPLPDITAMVTPSLSKSARDFHPESIFSLSLL